MRLRCANCRRTLLTVDTPPASQLHGTYGVLNLCGGCNEYEKKRIEEAQTNSIPDLLKLYLSGTGPTVQSYGET
jgi:hypothetical protein